jgi:predicted ATPase
LPRIRQSQTLISRLQVKNYRSLADVDISFGPLNVLVGPNSAGKSSIIDVLRFVRDIVSRSLDAAVLDRNGMSAIRRWSPKGAPYDVHISISLTAPDWRGDYSFIIGSERRSEYRVKWEKLSIDSKRDSKIIEDVFGIKGPIEIEVKNGKILEIPDRLERFVSLSRGSLSERNTLIFPQLTQLLPLGGIGDFYSFLTRMGFYTIYPDNLREPQKPANPYPLEEAGQNLASVLRNLKQQKSDDLDTIAHQHE